MADDDDDDSKKSSWLQSAFGFVADTATAAGSALADAGTAVVNKVEDAGSAITQGASTVVQNVEDAGSTVVQDAKTVVQKVEDTGSAVIQKVEDTGSAVVQKVEDAGGEIADDAKAVVQKVEDTGSAVVQKVEDEASSIASAADNLVAELEGDASSAVSTVEQKIKGAVSGEAKKAAGGDLNVNKELKGDVIKLPAITARAWGGRIVIQLLISFGFKATVSVPVDQLGKKVWDKWVADSGDKVITGGDLFPTPKVTKVDKDKKKALAVNWETQAPIGKWTLSAKAPSVGLTGISAPDVTGGLQGTLIKLGHMDIEGASVDDIEITTSGTIDMTLDMKVTLIRALGEEGAEDLVKDIVEADAFVSAEVTALVLVAVGTIVGTINELTKVGEEDELRKQVSETVEHFEAALRAGLTGSDTSPFVDPSSMAGFEAGRKGSKGGTQPLSAADADRYIATKVDAQAWENAGTGYWNKWMATHTGPSTFPEHAKLAWHACFQKRSGDPENDPDYQRWVKAKAAA